jgi:hypothetical protein
MITLTAGICPTSLVEVAQGFVYNFVYRLTARLLSNSDE